MIRNTHSRKVPQLRRIVVSRQVYLEDIFKDEVLALGWYKNNKELDRILPVQTFGKKLGRALQGRTLELIEGRFSLDFNPRQPPSVSYTQLLNPWWNQWYNISLWFNRGVRLAFLTLLSSTKSKLKLDRICGEMLFAAIPAIYYLH